MTLVNPTLDHLDPTVERRVASLGVALTRWAPGVTQPGPRDNPCLYLIEPDGRPPESWSLLSDWVRLPVEPVELLARAESLSARATARGTPGMTLDAEGVLRIGGTSIVLSELQARIFQHFFERIGELVRRDELIDLTWSGTPPNDPRAIDNRIKLLRQRLRGLPLEIHAIRGRGFVLERSPIS